MRKFLVLFVLLVAMPSAAREKPLWEIGAGLGSYTTPHYLGSDQDTHYVFPVPYLVYRGDIIKARRGGIMGKIYESDRLDLNVSLGGSLPVNNDDNKARKGMPDLDLMLEAGPSLQYRFFYNETHELRFDLQARAAIAVGDSVAYKGALYDSRLYYVFSRDSFTFKLSSGPRFATQKYQAYFYDVKKRYETPDRPEYKSEGGYLGMRYSASGGKRFGRLYIGAFLNYFDLDDVQNEDSPLMKSNSYQAIGLAISWVFAESKEMVDTSYE